MLTFKRAHANKQPFRVQTASLKQSYIDSAVRIDFPRGAVCIFTSEAVGSGRKASHHVLNCMLVPFNAQHAPKSFKNCPK